MELIGLLVMLLGMLFGLAFLIFWIWALVDVATKETDTNNNKLVWLLIVIFAGWIGALIYVLVRRPQRIREGGQ